MQKAIWVVLLGLASVIVVGMTGTGVWLVRRAMTRPPAPIVYAPGAHPKATWSGSGVEEDDEEVATPKLPAVKRAVPVFDARLLDGCSKADLDAIDTGITDAIGIGAPLYNEGDFGGCYRTYESAARALETSVGATCKGPVGALKAGRSHAASLSTPAQQAWAMRDQFDGLLDVMTRRGTEL